MDTDEEGAEFLLEKINHLHPKIKFTLEVEENNTINFLDIKITRNDNTLKFGIFRKPSQTDHVIPEDSNHHPQHKMAAFRCYVHRLLTIPLSDASYQTELNIIKQIAVNNGYEPEIVESNIAETT